ncbi:MAG: 23S rRNA (pseudouridine(1915)-N(3))-methyltransferase RlmH [Gammaproteobacteria bacterium]|nr:MAG: 23S rRNA (pseudouridine(1915)-N(3))-methyltransferase RlmH [Gammaproteobacteria bacterium]
MRLRILTVGSKMAAWVQAGYQEYTKRLPVELKIELVETPLAQRRKGEAPDRAIQLEGKALLKALTKNDHVVALAVDGKAWNTEQLAQNLRDWQNDGNNISFLIGGPDGLDTACLARANQQWSLSAMTLPHPLVRIMLAEQLYRAWSINAGHPYHR